jgi:hypothetical protein
MLLSFETRKAIEENVDGCMDKETYYLARDILNAITDDNGNPVRPCDAKVVTILARAVADYENSSLDDIKQLIRF